MPFQQTHLVFAVALALAGTLPIAHADPAATPVAAPAAAGTVAITRSPEGNVTLSCASKGAVIRYSLDGSAPSSDSITYLAPFLLRDGGTVKAQAYSADNRPLGAIAIVTLPKMADVAAPDGVTLSDWQGFRKAAFDLDGAQAQVIAPKITAPGKPWVLRTGVEILALEEELLRAGCHVARIDRATPALREKLAAKLKAQWGVAEKPVVAETKPGAVPFTVAREILAKAYTLPAGREYFELRDGLANCREKFTKVKTGRIAFVGGSITFNPGWRDELMRYFRLRFPETKFDFVASGIPSVGSLGHAFRLENDILAGGVPDLVFVEAAVNDHNYDHLKEEACGKLALRGMEGVVRQLRRVAPRCDIVEMHFVHDQDLGTYAKKRPSCTIAAHEKVAAHYGCPSLDLSREVFDRIQAKEFTWAADFRNLHPSPYGQRVYANSMTRMLDFAFAQKATPKPHALPATPLDPASFGNGRYSKLEDATLTSGFTLDPNWVPKVKQETRPGFVRCLALVADAPGAEMRYTFNGTAFGLFLAAGRDTGVIAYTVDGGPEQSLDTIAPWSSALHLPWPLMLAEGLKPGKHEVVIRTTDKNPNRTALHIIHVLLN